MEGFNLNDKRISDDKIVIPKGVNRGNGMKVLEVFREIFPDEYDHKLLDWLQPFFKGDSLKFHSGPGKSEKVEILEKMQKAYQTKGAKFLDQQELKRFMETIKKDMKEKDLKRDLRKIRTEALQYGDEGEDPKNLKKGDVVDREQVNNALRDWKKDK